MGLYFKDGQTGRLTVDANSSLMASDEGELLKLVSTSDKDTVEMLTLKISRRESREERSRVIITAYPRQIARSKSPLFLPEDTSVAPHSVPGFSVVQRCGYRN